MTNFAGMFEDRIDRPGVSQKLREREERRRGPVAPEDALKACLYSLEHPEVSVPEPEYDGRVA
jgi:hypothetical protein